MKRLGIVSIVLSVLFTSCSQPSPPTEEQPQTELQKTDSLITMSVEAQKHIGLQVTPAEIKRLAEYLQVTGTVQPIDNRVARVRPIANGRLMDVLVRVGDRVERSQVLASFDNIEAGDLTSQYRSARAELQRLRTQLAVAAQQTERNRRLVEIGAASRKELELSEAEQKSIESNIEAQEGVIAGVVARLNRFGLNEQELSSSAGTSIRSPFSGVVTYIRAAPGEIVGPESELFQIADLSQVWVQAEVFEKDLGRIRVGQTAIIHVDTYPDQEFLGRVTHIADILDPQTRTAKVRCELANVGYKLKLDMFATVRLPTTFQKNALAIPAEAVQQVEGKTVVFIQKEDTQYEMRAVELGQTVQGITEVLAGLQAQDPIVTRGAFHLKSIVLGEQLGEGEEEEKER